MALDFPSSPTVGQQYLNWTWNGVAWVVTPGPPLASLAQSAQNAGRNYLDNALFNIQQRGAGPWSTQLAYTADRWFLSLVNDTLTISLVSLADSDRTAIGDEAAIYALQCVFVGSSTSGSYSDIIQRIESVRRLSGKTVTVSFYARAISGTPKLGIGYATYYGSGGSSSAGLAGNIGITPALAATWQRYSVTGTLPSASGKTFGTTAGTDFTALYVVLSDQGGAASVSGGIGVQSGTVQFWGMQVEVGSQATPLEKLVPEVDLARCQRFYQAGSFFLQGYQAGGGTWGNGMTFPVTMRAAPTGTVQVSGAGNMTGVAFNTATNYSANYTATVTTSGYGYAIFNLTLSADL